jgi:serine/threonine protein kinase
MISKRDATVVKIALRRGFLRDDQVAAALAEAAADGSPIEERLLARGVLTPEQKEEVLRALADSGERRGASAEVDLDRRMRELEQAKLAAAGPEEKRLTPERIRNAALDPRGYEFGPYAIEEEIARGGMGVLYRARHLGAGLGDAGAGGLPNEVALKVIMTRQGSLAAAADLERFIREIRTLITLRHPNIVRIFDAGKEGEVHYYTMELIRGESLKDFVRARPMPLVLALAVVREIASALGAMHAAGFLHRDVKPQNILLDKEASPFRPVLIDFGLIKGREAGALTGGTGEVAGTPAYMAPEQTDGTGGLGEVGPWSDLYALGAVLYYCLARRSPFQGARAEEVIAQVRRDPPKRPDALVPGLPARVVEICMKCLAKRPAERYHEMKALIADLDREIERARGSLRRENLWLRVRKKLFRR